MNDLGPIDPISGKFPPSTIELLDKPINTLRDKTDEEVQRDAIDPPHYRSHPSGVECIAITEHMGFNLGNAIKYIWRANLKASRLEDLRKAQWYLAREIARL